VPRNQEEHRKNSARESYDEHRIPNAEPTSPEFLAATVHEFSTKSSCKCSNFNIHSHYGNPLSIFSTVAGNSVNTATAANSRNSATTTRQFVKARIKFKTSELKSLAIFQDHHANFRRVSHGIRN
jgi:hypothetical protein